MDFEHARTGGQAERRQAEILDACAALYGEEGFGGVTIKAIAARTSFSRPSIYNYYETREEILLDLLKREFQSWARELRARCGGAEAMDRAAFCRMLTELYEDHELILRLLTRDLGEIENRSREERLCAFKGTMAEVQRELDAALARFFPAAPVRERALFCLSQLALAEGVYPMTHLSDKQERAMEQAGFPRPEAFGTLFCEGLLRLMSGFGG